MASMCRLFGLNASPNRIRASFWLLEAPDSLVHQSIKNPDGTGLGYFAEDGTPILDKEPLPAFEDPAFVREAKSVESSTFISHVRYATTGEKKIENCHPFAMDGRLFAHNGVLGGLDKLEAQLAGERSLVHGQTDSERYFALITREIRARRGDVAAGMAAAVRWIASNLPVFSINCLLATPREMWAFRYPETHSLYVLEREPGGLNRERPLHYVSETLRVHSEHLAEQPAVVVASEPLDDHPEWRALRSGELLHIGPDLKARSELLIEGPPAYPLILKPHGKASRPGGGDDARSPAWHG